MVVFVLTFVKTFRERKRTVAGVTSVQDLMLRDGKAIHTTTLKLGALRSFAHRGIVFCVSPFLISHKYEYLSECPISIMACANAANTMTYYVSGIYAFRHLTLKCFL